MAPRRRGTSAARAVRSLLARLGLQAKTADVVAALAAHGIVVGEALVQRIRLEMLKQMTRGRGYSAPDVGRSMWRPPKIPPRRGR